MASTKLWFVLGFEFDILIILHRIKQPKTEQLEMEVEVVEVMHEKKVVGFSKLKKRQQAILKAEAAGQSSDSNHRHFGQGEPAERIRRALHAGRNRWRANRRRRTGKGSAKCETASFTTLSYYIVHPVNFIFRDLKKSRMGTSSEQKAESAMRAR
jgi:hypothetical protein